MFTNSLTLILTLALLALSSFAAPLTARQAVKAIIPGIERHDLCPPGMQYRSSGACASGYTGCARAEDFDTCSGVGFPNLARKCARPEYGTYRECPDNGFYGCSVEDICNTPGPNFKATPTIPGVVRGDLCPQDSNYKSPGQCASGFVGCIFDSDTSTCDFNVTGVPILLGTCLRAQYGSYRTCDNGFFGCHPDANVCSAPKLPSSPPTNPPTVPPIAPSSPPTVPPANNALLKFCPAGSKYYAPKACSSGFVGCGSDAQCSGSQRFWWGDCPTGTGTFYICSVTKFVGCTTIQNPYPCN